MDQYDPATEIHNAATIIPPMVDVLMVHSIEQDFPLSVVLVKDHKYFYTGIFDGSDGEFLNLMQFDTMDKASESLNHRVTALYKELQKQRQPTN